MAKDIKTFDEFWLHYVKAHSNKTNRTLHFVGTSAALALAATGFFTGKKRFLLLAPVVGYGFAWTGHFLVERNIPATFGHPAWSLLADFKMWRMIIDGTMDAEVERVLSEYPEDLSPSDPTATTVPDPTLN